MSFDLLLFNLIHGGAGISSMLDSLGIFCARYVPYVLVIAFFIFLIREVNWKKRMEIALWTGITLLISDGLITQTIRFFYQRARPFVTLNFTPLIANTDPSFPSGHMAFFGALSLMVFFYNRTWGWWFFSATAVNGLARIFVGVHWPSDIVGGIVVALFSFFVVKEVLMKRAQ